MHACIGRGLACAAWRQQYIKGYRLCCGNEARESKKLGNGRRCACVSGCVCICNMIGTEYKGKVQLRTRAGRKGKDGEKRRKKK